MSSPIASRRRGGIVAKSLVALTVIGGAAWGGFVLLSGDAGESTTEDRPDLALVTIGGFEVINVASGELEARKQTELRSPIEGRTTVTEIISEGSFVKEGDVLVRLSTDEIEKQFDTEMLQLEAAKSALISAENALAIVISDNESALSKAQLDLQLAELELKKWREGDHPTRLLELETTLDAAQRQKDRLSDKLDRSKTLYEREFLSSDELRNDEIAYLRAEADLEIARVKLETYTSIEVSKERQRLESDVEEKKKQIDRVKSKNASGLAQKEATLTNSRRTLALRQEKVDKLNEQLEAATIKAPTGGLVVYASSVGNNWRWNNEGPLAVGSEVRHNEELIVLPDTSEIMAAIKIHESLIGRVRPGQTARIKIDARRDTVFTGTVESIGIMAESGGWRDPNLREYEVKIALDIEGSDHGLKPSMRAEAEVVLGTVEDATIVPVQGVFTEGRTNYVYTPEGSNYRRVPVAVGRRSDAYAEVLGGIEEGLQIALVAPSVNRVIEEEFDEETVAQLQKTAMQARMQATGRGAPRAQPAAATGGAKVVPSSAAGSASE
ncbi:MAG: HlyD family efflux transporter periplasmic adaptor subunit [Planctomycetota bacterium]